MYLDSERLDTVFLIKERRKGSEKTCRHIYASEVGWMKNLKSNFLCFTSDFYTNFKDYCYRH